MTREFRELNGKLWSGLHNKTRQRETVRWRLAPALNHHDADERWDIVCLETHARFVAGRRRRATDIRCDGSLAGKSDFRCCRFLARIGLVYSLYPGGSMEADDCVKDRNFAKLKLDKCRLESNAVSDTRVRVLRVSRIPSRN